MQVEVAGQQLELKTGDLTLEEVDAIVNAANAALAGGGGVDGAIHRRGGPSLMAETARRYPEGCPTGKAVITGGGQLAARYVIHTVGPRWKGGGRGEADLLASAHRSSLQLAVEHGCRSVAFPAISTGVYGYPIDQASRVAVQTVIDFLAEQQAPALVRFVLFDDRAYEVFAETLRSLLPTR